MAENSPITHEGIVHQIDGNHITVKLTVQSACASCHAKGMCGTADSQDKLVHVRNLNDEHYEIGERVRVELRQSLAMRAVVICYLIPFILLIGSFCLMSYFVQNELINVAVSFGVIIAYYFIIWLSNKKIEKKFAFYITKLPQY